MKYQSLLPITFVDHNIEVINELASGLGKFPDCRFIHGDIFEAGPGTLVSPSNSYGDMGGGIDKVYSERFPGIEDRLHEFIENDYAGRLDIGQALTLPTHDKCYPYMVFSPTVETAGDIATKQSVYLASRAVLLETIMFNDKTEKSKINFGIGWIRPRKIERLLIPGLGTGSGGLPAEDSAQAIKRGFTNIYQNLDKILAEPERFDKNIYL